MFPELLHLHLPFSLPIIGTELRLYSYGLMLVIGFLVCIELAKFLARRTGFDPEVFVNAGMLALISGVIGARVSHILENWHEFTRAPSLGENIVNMLNLRSGGLTFYGGLMLAFPVLILYGIIKKVPIPRGMDIMAPCITLGLAIGRIGCFANGCCYGAECNLPWAVQFPYGSNAYVEQAEKGEIRTPQELMSLPDLRGRQHPRSLEELKNDPELLAMAKAEKSLPVHPAQLYSTFTSLLITAALLAYFTIAPPAGMVMALMLMLEGATRFLLEMVRAEPPVAPQVFGNMSLSMVIGMFVFIAGVFMWLYFRRRPTVEPRVFPGIISTAKTAGD